MMKKKYLSMIVIIICFLLVSTSSAASSHVSDQLAAPKTIIFHLGKKNIKINNGRQFDEVLNLVNQRLKGAEIITDAIWDDYDLAKRLSNLKTIEFDYSHLQESSFNYVGDINLPLNGTRPKHPCTYIDYTKLIFPLSDKKKEGPYNEKFSLSIFSYGDPRENINGGAADFQTYPIGSPSELIDYLKGIQ